MTSDSQLGAAVRAIVERDGSLSIDRDRPIGEVPTTYTVGADCGSDRGPETDADLGAALLRYSKVKT